MKKVYHIFFILNILFSISIIVNILFLASYNTYSIPIMIGVIIFYLGIIITYFKKNIDIKREDFIVLSLYAIFLIFYIVYIINYQSNNSTTYNMLYFSKIILLPSLIYSIYNLFERD